MKYWLVIAIITLSALASAETSGQITTGTFNVSVITGLFGYSVDYCNAGYECFDYTCFLDWDATGGGGKAGWCNLSSITSCYHNGTVSSTGSAACDTSTSYRTCANGVWGSSASCSGNLTCSDGLCASSSSASSSSSSGSSSSSTVNFDQKISILQTSDISILQGAKIIKTLTVKNVGNRTLFNVSVGVSGIDASWVSIGPSKVNITINGNVTFGLEFTIPQDAVAKVYDVIATATTSNSSVVTSVSFKVSVLPTKETVQNVILPSYNSAALRFSELEKKIVALEESCTDTKLLRSNIEDINGKMTRISDYIDSEDYVNANTLIDDAARSLEELNQKIVNTHPGSCGGISIDIVYVVAGIVVAAAVIMLLYLFWPQKAQSKFNTERGWTTPKEKTKKKKDDEEFIYDFKRKHKE